MKKIYAAIISLLLIAILPSCSVNPVTGKKQVSFMSESQELAIGQQSDPAIIGEFGLYNDSILQRFIQKKGEAMGLISHRPDLKYNFRVVDSPILNAFAVPGGYVYFTRGIMGYFNDEAQFAGVLGHEIGHITARHAAQQQTKQILTQIAFIGGMIASEKFRNMSESAMQAMQLLFLKYSREDESQSDELGVKYSSSIGYDAVHMADFFKTLERYSEKEGARVPEFMSTHPDPGNRYVRVTQLAKEYQQANHLSNLAVNRDAYLRMIDGIIYGEDPRQGYLDKSTNTFYHPEMKFQFPVPSGWQFQNSPGAVQCANQEGTAAIVLTLSSQKTFQAATQEILQSYEMNIVGTPTSTTLNGIQAYSFYAEQAQQTTTTTTTSSQSADIVAMQTTLYNYNGNIYVLQGMSYKKDFATNKNIFSTSLNGFKALTDPAKINVIPEKIKVVQVMQNASLKDVLLFNKMPTSRLEELAILNGMQQTDNVPAGSLIKIVVK